MIGKSPRPQSRSSAMGKAKSAPAAKSAAPSRSPRPAPRPADLMENYNLNRAMRGTESKAIKQDLKAARGAGGSSSGGKKDAVRIFSSSSSRSAGARGPKMVSRFKDGGCVMAGRGGKYKGEM